MIPLQLLYLLLPAREGIFRGLPLGIPAICAALLILFLRVVWPDRTGQRWQLVLLCALGAIKLTLAPLLCQHGLLARYHASTGCAGPPERSTEFLTLSDTRIDTRFAWKERDFPLHFFNDLTRFNFYHPDEPRRDLLPFSICWHGFLRTPAAGTTFHVRSANPVEIRIDGNPVSANVPLGAGLHAIAIRYSNPYGSPRGLTIGPLPPEQLFVAPPTEAQVRRSAMAAPVLLLVDLGYCALLLLCLLRCAARRPPSAQRTFLAAGVLLSAGAGMALLSPIRGRLILLSGGDDWLTYESFARDILLHGPLMLMGAPLGQATPFHYQVLYPYFLALCHLIFGEDLFGPLFLQTSGLFLSGALLCLIGRRLFGPLSGQATLVLWLVSLPLTGEYVMTALRLLSENLAFVLFPLSALLFIEFMGVPQARTALSCGAVFGLTVLARSVTLPAYPVLLWLALRPWRERRRRWPLLALMTLSFLLVAALPGVRNRIAAGTLRFLPQSGTYNLLLRNPPPPSVDLSRTTQRPLYRVLGLSMETRAVLEYARQAPAVFSVSLLKKALFSLGLYRAPGIRAEFHPMPPVFVYLWLSLLCYLLDRKAWRAEAAVLLAFAGAQLVVMPLFAPTLQYGNRLALPFYLFLFPFGGRTLAALLQWCR